MPEITYNPYEGVDWSIAGIFSTDFHTHCWKTEDTEPEMIQWHATEPAPTPADGERTGYNFYGYSADGHDSPRDQDTAEQGGELYGFWGDVEERDPVLHRECNAENQDPEALDCVAYRCREHVGGELEHVHDLFGKDYPAPGEIEGNDSRQGAVGVIIQNDGHAVIAHPQEYRQLGDEDPTEYSAVFDEFPASDRFSGTDCHPEDYPEFAEYDRTDGLLGVEVIGCKGHFFDGWDTLLDYYTDRDPIFGYPASDLQSAMSIGDESMRFETAIVTHPDNIDASDQEGSRETIRKCFEKGCAVGIVRSSWDDDTENSPTVPIINSIDVDGNTITIDATDAGEIRWISSGETVETGETITITDDEAPYVRAELESNPDGMMFTQPIGVSTDLTATIGDATLGDITFGGN